MDAGGSCWARLRSSRGTAVAHPERQAFFPDPQQGRRCRSTRRAQQEAADRLQVATRSGSSSKIFKGKKRAASGCMRLRAAQAVPLPQHPDGGQPRQEQRPHPILPGVYREKPSRKVPVDQAAVRVDVRDARRRRRAGAELRAPGQVPELAQPDRDHRRLARRPGPRVRPQVQPPDGGHRPQAQGRQDRGRPAEEGRHPRRPRRRLLPPQRVGRAGRVQRRRRRRDQRLPPAATWSRPYAQNYGVLTFASDHGLYDAHRRLRQRRLRASTRAPVPRATASATGSRSATSTRTTTCSATRAPRATAPGRTTRGSTTTTPASPTTRSPPATRACRRTARSGTTNQVNSNNQNFFTNDRDTYCKNTPFEKRPKEIVCPQFQVPVGSGFILYGVNSNLIQNNRDLRQLALGRAPVLGAGGDPRRQRPGAPVRHLERQPVHRQPDGRQRARASARPNGVDFFWDEEGKGNCWLGNQAPGGKVTSDPASLPRCPNSGLFQPSNPSKSAAEVPCAQWDPKTNPDPPGCTWFTTPPKPASQ